jgi:hypothetical protein
MKTAEQGDWLPTVACGGPTQASPTRATHRDAKPASSRRGLHRRAFLHSLGRGFGLLSIGFAAALLTRKQRRLAAAGQVCVNRGICGNCPVFGGCELPNARSARRDGASAP